MSQVLSSKGAQPHPSYTLLLSAQTERTWNGCRCFLLPLWLNVRRIWVFCHRVTIYNSNVGACLASGASNSKLRLTSRPNILHPWSTPADSNINLLKWHNKNLTGFPIFAMILPTLWNTWLPTLSSRNPVSKSTIDRIYDSRPTASGQSARGESWDQKSASQWSKGSDSKEQLLSENNIPIHFGWIYKHYFFYI